MFYRRLRMKKSILFFLIQFLILDSTIYATGHFSLLIQNLFMRNEEKDKRLRAQVQKFQKLKQECDGKRKEKENAKEIFKKTFKDIFVKHREEQERPALLKGSDQEIHERSKNKIQELLERFNSEFNEFSIAQSDKEREEYKNRFEVLNPIYEEEDSPEYDEKYRKFEIFISELNGLIESFFDFFIYHDDFYKYLDFSDLADIFYSGLRYSVGLTEQAESYFMSLFAGDRSERMLHLLDKQSVKNEMFLRLLWEKKEFEDIPISNIYKLLREENDVLMLSTAGKEFASQGNASLSEEYLALSKYSGYRIVLLIELLKKIKGDTADQIFALILSNDSKLAQDNKINGIDFNPEFGRYSVVGAYIHRLLKFHKKVAEDPQKDAHHQFLKALSKAISTIRDYKEEKESKREVYINKYRKRISKRTSQKDLDLQEEERQYLEYLREMQNSHLEKKAKNQNSILDIMIRVYT